MLYLWLYRGDHAQKHVSLIEEFTQEGVLQEPGKTGHHHQHEGHQHKQHEHQKDAVQQPDAAGDGHVQTLEPGKSRRAEVDEPQQEPQQQPEDEDAVLLKSIHHGSFDVKV